ncbi:hypothetical protein PXH80_33355, partial [Mycolicibacterium smegmatis]|uniref:hypothetical protein n=1 Tax=Mycolicibacterium smegmatis TaxID=1772 RepID=UPI0023DC005F
MLKQISDGVAQQKCSTPLKSGLIDCVNCRQSLRKTTRGAPHRFRTVMFGVAGQRISDTATMLRRGA